MVRPQKAGGKRGSAARTRKASRAKGGNHKTRSQKTSSSRKKASRAKTSITEKTQIEHLARELEEARQQQAASSRVLHIIGTSPGALTPVFQAIVKSAVEVCQARFGAVFRMEAGLMHLVADYNFGATLRQLVEAEYPVAPSRGRVSGRSILTRSTVQIPDTDADKDYTGRNAKQSGFRSLLAAPLLKGDQAIGSIVIYKAEPGTFPPQQMASLQSFATQAVIAIENARLFDETKEALERQTATADILRVIASSPTEIAPVLETIVRSASELCYARDATVLLKDGNDLRYSMHYGPIPIGLDKWPLGRRWVAGRCFLDKAAIQVRDLLSAEGDEFPEGREMARAQGHRTVLCVPLLRDGEAIGVLGLRRVEIRPFTDNQIALLETFADQAVIAIENARLFDEVQAKTRDLERRWFIRRAVPTS
jgi:two-component system, NtrC family, sensor kinase